MSRYTIYPNTGFTFSFNDPDLCSVLYLGRYTYRELYSLINFPHDFQSDSAFLESDFDHRILYWNLAFKNQTTSVIVLVQIRPTDSYAVHGKGFYKTFGFHKWDRISWYLTCYKRDEQKAIDVINFIRDSIKENQDLKAKAKQQAQRKHYWKYPILKRTIKYIDYRVSIGKPLDDSELAYWEMLCDIESGAIEPTPEQRAKYESEARRMRRSKYEKDGSN